MPRIIQALFLLVPMATQAATPQRCDLVSRPEAVNCLDLSKLDGAILRVPANTTRIPTNALSLCGFPGSVPPPVDIMYVVDQTASMVPTAILASAEDTSGWYECASSLDMVGDKLKFHGNTVTVIDPATSTAQAQAACKPAGDPYNVRVGALQAAIQAHATASPRSFAGTINFGPSVQSSQPMTALATAAGVTSLLNSLKLQALSGTNYEVALTWARIQLYGGKSGTRTIPSSPNAHKAILIVSDGRPSKGTWQNALDPVADIKIGDTTWTTLTDSLPPVYGIFLGTDGTEGSTLRTVADSTGGQFYQIPPNMPDSLALVIKRILGTLIQPARPDSFSLLNATNGQASKSVASRADGIANHLQLDSLVGLEPGANQLHLVLAMGNQTLRANWTILVADTTTTVASSPLDPLLLTRCGPASLLTLRPDRSGLAWADTADRNVLVSLTTHAEGTRLPIEFLVQKSADRELLQLPVLQASDSLRRFDGSIPFQELVWTSPVPGDLVLRSGPGWDSALATFRMPRDRRDTASARIALHHLAIAQFEMTPEVDGPTGRVEVVVTDPNRSSSSLTITLRHRLGDSLVVTLRRSLDGTYRGSATFEPATAPAPLDTILELGPLGASVDSFSGSYQNLTSQTVVHPPLMELRLIGSAGPLPSLGFDLAMGDSIALTVEAWINHSPCTTCGGWLTIAPSDPAIAIQNKGQNLTATRLVSGRATLMVKGLKPVSPGFIRFDHDSLAATITARPIRVLPQAPDSVVYYDTDGDGALNAAKIYSRQAWNPTSILHLTWTDSTRPLDWTRAGFSLSDDSLVARFDFPPLAPDTTSATAPQARWNLPNWPIQKVTVFERIAPVPLRAVLARGARIDTLRLFPSEKLWPGLNPIDRLVGVLDRAALHPLSPRQARLETSSGALVLLLGSDSNQVHPGDSVRFLSAIQDLFGNSPGPSAKSVVVEGTDALPRQALVVDSDADGRADQVVVHLTTPLRVTDRMGFWWPDRNGILAERWLPIATARRDSADQILTFDLDPWDFGATSCPSDGCDALGWMSTSRFGAEVRSRFALQDGVHPIPLDAHYRFSADGQTSDSLFVTFSEPMRSSTANPEVSLGRPSLDSFGVPLIGAKPRWNHSRELLLLVDSLAVGNDSLRIAYPKNLVDTAGNYPERLAWWTAINWGQPPARFRLSLPHAVVSAPIAMSQEPPLTLVLSGPDGLWTAPALAGLSERFGGPILHLNRIPQNLSLYIYDNQGTAVLHREFPNLADLESQHLLGRDRRGEYKLWLAWNGNDAKGNPVSSGIYGFRVCARFREGTSLSVVNTVIREGLFRNAP